MYGVSWFVGYFIRIIRLLVGFVVLGFREPKYSERWGVDKTISLLASDISLKILHPFF